MSEANDRISNIVKEKLRSQDIIIETLKPGCLAFRVSPDLLFPTIKAILAVDEDATLSTISGVDLDDRIELLYHLRALGTIATVRCEMPSEKPSIPSITTFLPGANFHERETADFFGVKFVNHPDSQRLVVPEAWPENLYPLRKKAEIPSTDTRFENISQSVTTGSNETSTMTIIIGPQHPALLEPERFDVEVDGETVVKVRPRIGYAH
jgi:Ni,Fe-hydrogenase III component G